MRIRAITAPKAPRGFLLTKRPMCCQMAPVGIKRPGSARLWTLLCPCYPASFLVPVLWPGRLTVTDSGVQPAVDQIQKQVQNQYRDGYQHDDGLNFRVVPVEYAIKEELAHPRHHEDVLDHHGTSQEAAKLEAGDGDHG